MFYRNGRKIYTSENGRKSIRLKGYDYSQAGLYFITICCQDRAHLFGKIIEGEMILNEFGMIAHQEWLNSENIRNNLKLHEFIIMPNHIHGIIEIIFQKDNGRNGEDIGKFKSPSQTIGSIVRGFKIATIKKIKNLIGNLKAKEEARGRIMDSDIGGCTGELQFAPTAPTAPTKPIQIIKSLNYKIWQRNYYEHIIRDFRAYQNISNYIINNPNKWKEDKFNKEE